jgi:hypothetical protein
VGESPESRSARFQDGQEAVQVLGELGARLDAVAGGQYPQRLLVDSGRAAAGSVACLDGAGGLDAESQGDPCSTPRDP